LNRRRCQTIHREIMDSATGKVTYITCVTLHLFTQLSFFCSESQNNNDNIIRRRRITRGPYKKRTKHAERLEFLSWKRQLVVSALRRSRVSGLGVMRRRPCAGHGERVLFSLHVQLVFWFLHKSSRFQRDRAVLGFLCTKRKNCPLMQVMHNVLQYRSTTSCKSQQSAKSTAGHASRFMHDHETLVCVQAF